MNWSINFPVLLLLIFLNCVAFLHREGTWSNAVTLINVVFAILLAVNFWEPLARALEETLPSFTFMFDMLTLWLPFCLFLAIFQMITKMASKYQVRFRQLHDRIGGIFFASLIGWAMVCFTTMTLHTAPLAENFMSGGFKPDEGMLFGLAPDKYCLGLIKLTSQGSFKRWETQEFDPGEDFIFVYAERRAFLEEYAVQQKGFLAKESDMGKPGFPKR